MRSSYDLLRKKLAQMPPAKRKVKKKTNKKRSKTFINPKVAKGLPKLKSANISSLKWLREAVERGDLTREEALGLQHKWSKYGLIETDMVLPQVTPITPTLTDRLQDIRTRKQDQRVERKNSVIIDGFIYLVTNPAHPEWVKVGQTSDYEGRLSTYQTASPHADYSMVQVRYVDDRRAAEAKFLELADARFEIKGEWIKASVDDLLSIFIGV